MSAAPEPQEFAAKGPVTANLRAGGGAITVVAEDNPVTVVSVTPYDDSEASRAAAEQTKVRFADDRLRVETPRIEDGWIFRRSGRVRIDLRLPLDSLLHAEVGSADVHAEGRLADVSVQAGSGDTYVTHTTGDLSVESGSGDVRADEVGGALRVKTGSGDVFASAVDGPTTVSVASGAVEIENAGDAVRASSASGDVRIGSANGGEVQVKSASGDVSVGVPAGTRAWLDLSTMSGNTRNDLEMMGATVGGDAQVKVIVRTMSGDITVCRAA